MKIVMAVIKPFKFEDLIAAVRELTEG